MKVSIVGTGYVGLVTGTCFAEMGNEVTCVDIDAQKVKSMQDGNIPFYEPDLEPLFKRNIKEGRLQFSTELESSIGAAAIFLALPTPEGEDGSADLSYVLDVADKLGQLLTDYTVIVTKSTVPIGTAEEVRDAIAANAKADFDVVSNPEFLREGVAVNDFMKPDRVVIGTDSDKAKEVMHELYEPFVRQGNPIETMSHRSAEAVKYAANSLLALRISAINEIARICELTGANVEQVRRAVGLDPRIGKQFLYPGIGYGGSCFPKDVKALIKTGQQHGFNMQILEAVQAVNEMQKHWIFEKVTAQFGENLKGKKFALWGLSFKPDTDDIREAPSLTVINDLLEAGTKIKAYDPEAIDNTRKFFGIRKKGLSFADNEYDALDGADALLIVTEWKEFRSPDFGKMKQLLKEPVIFDGRNLFTLTRMRREGFHYQSVGRQIVEND